MTNEQILLIQSILTSLMTISTKGEDTLKMADCLRALNKILEESKKEDA